MPFFSGFVSSRGQILIPVLIAFPSDNASSPSGHTYNALVDTGANISCISTQVVKDLRLKPEGKKKMQSATDNTTANLYHVSLHIPMNRTDGGKITNHFHSTLDTEVAEIMQGDTHDVLLGMDVIVAYSLFIVRGDFTLSY